MTRGKLIKIDEKTLVSDTIPLELATDSQAQQGEKESSNKYDIRFRRKEQSVKP